MRLLLDTHAWLWQLADPERLSRKASMALDDPSHELFLSPISVWETLMLADGGRVDLGGDPHGWVRAALAASPTVMAEMTHDIAILSRDLPGYRGRDPADRFLIATALHHDLTLVTRDRRIREYRTVPSLW